MAALANAGQHLRLREVQPKLLRLLDPVQQGNCPAIQAERIEIGKLFLQFSATDLRAGSDIEGESGPSCLALNAAEDIRRGLQLICRKALQSLKAHELPGGTVSSAGQIQRRAMQPVLIDSAVSGLLDAASAIDTVPDSQAGGEVKLEDTSEDQKGEQGSCDIAEGLALEDLDLCLDSSTDVKRAALKRLAYALSKGVTGNFLTFRVLTR